MSLAVLKNKFSRKTIKILSLFVILFGISTVVFAQIPPVPDTPENDPTGFQGTVQGFAWMGTNIQNPGSSSEGGGGWLKFNCAPEDCSNAWGVTADMDQSSSTAGRLSGQAWSNNYGWLDFSDDNVQSCWEANQGETFDGPAKILFPTGKIVGWGKFLAGDDFPDDGWDGCVSFSGVEYGVNVDLATGVVSGWAWGSDVVGWISFTNPECPFCDVTIVIERIIGCMDPTATNYNPLANAPGRCIYGEIIIGCMDPLATNYNPLANSPGRCSYGPPVRGCTDPAANNYNPAATIDDGSCTYGPGPTRPTLNLQVTPDVFVLDSGNYQVGPITWTSSNPSLIVPNSCSANVERISGASSLTFNLPGWSGPRPNPNYTISATPGFDLTSQMVGATTTTSFRFNIRCQIVGGGTVSDDDTILVIEPINPPTEPPSIWLHIEDPNTDSALGPASLLQEVIPPWSATLLSGGVDPLTLRWQALNVVDGSCLGESAQYIGADPDSVGANSVWDVLPLGLDSLGYGTLDLNVTSEQDIRNTRFQIKCHPLNAPTTWISAQVCMRVDGQTFPQSQCSAGNSINRPPGYKEI